MKYKCNIYYKPECGAFLEGFGFMLNKLINYIKETRIELRSVEWPTRQKTMNYTLLVIAVSLAVAAFLGSFDMLFTYLLGKFVL